MRWLRLAAPAALVAAWLAGSVAQQPGTPPAGTPPSSTPPAASTPPSAPRPAAPPAQEQERERPPAAGDDEDDEDDVFVPTEELQPDAAVTFPVDI